LRRPGHGKELAANPPLPIFLAAGEPGQNLSFFRIRILSEDSERLFEKKSAPQALRGMSEQGFRVVRLGHLTRAEGRPDGRLRA
jgi:hypothetical protein